jgi:hypothetical protein
LPIHHHFTVSFIQRAPEAPVCSEVISQTGNGERQRKTKYDMGGVREKRFEGLDYHKELVEESEN